MVNPDFTWFFVLFFSGMALGCGDGIGRPLREDPRVTEGWGGSGFGGQGFAGPYSPFDAGTSLYGGVPSSEYCADVDAWPQAAAVSEEGMVDGLNTARALGTRCDSSTETGTGTPFVVMTAELRCSARLHARDMILRGFFDDVNPEGEGPGVRIARAGYTARVTAEVVASGDLPPYAILQQLFSRGSADCEILLNPQFTAVGVGEYEGSWAIDLAGP